MRWNHVDFSAEFSPLQFTAGVCYGKLVDIEKNVLIKALNKDFINITGPVLNMMEINEAAEGRCRLSDFSILIIMFLGHPYHSCERHISGTPWGFFFKFDTMST